MIVGVMIVSGSQYHSSMLIESIVKYMFKLLLFVLKCAFYFLFDLYNQHSLTSGVISVSFLLLTNIGT